MPWSETSAMDEKVRFIGDYQRDLQSLSELCERYGISRKTGYKWIDRYQRQGPAGLQDLSRRPHGCLHQTAPEVVEALLEARRRHPRWGAKKLLKIVSRRYPDWEWPARSTACDILKRHGLIPKGRRRPHPGHPGRPLTPMDSPNQIWTADFKGHFLTRDGFYCYPLTVEDGYSRFLLACQALPSTRHEGSRPVFLRLFRQYGLPNIIRTDNGAPFATTALGRLSLLSVWWIRLGIYPELIEPAHPEQNGRHERMQRTLKAETARPPSGNLSSQQRRQFQHEYNQQRPHEALNQETPASRYLPSSRKLPNTLPPTHYPPHFEVRLVSRNGGIRWNGHWVNVTQTLGGEHVGLEEVDNDLWDVYFGPIKLGRFDQRTLKIHDQVRPTKRHEKVLPMSPD